MAWLFIWCEKQLIGNYSWKCIDISLPFLFSCIYFFSCLKEKLKKKKRSVHWINLHVQIWLKTAKFSEGVLTHINILYDQYKLMHWVKQFYLSGSITNEKHISDFCTEAQLLLCIPYVVISVVLGKLILVKYFPSNRLDEWFSEENVSYLKICMPNISWQNLLLTGCDQKITYK